MPKKRANEKEKEERPILNSYGFNQTLKINNFQTKKKVKQQNFFFKNKNVN